MTAPTAEEIARKIRPALTKLYVTYFRVAEQSALTGPQLSLMTRMKNNGDSRISQLAREEGIRMPTASNALHQLEQRGMVERIRDTEDRRGVRVRLTEFGEQELDRVGRERDTFLAQMLQTLPPEQLANVDALSQVILDLAEGYSNTLEEKPAAGKQDSP